MRRYKQFKKLFKAIDLLRAFCGQQTGSVAIIFALSAVVFMGVTGIAIDYGRAYSAKSALQAALDGAVISGVTAKPDPQEYTGVLGGLSQAQRITRAEQSFQANRPVNSQINSVSFVYENQNLVGRANAEVKTSLTALLGFNSIDVSSIAGASSAPTKQRLCFLAMHPTRKHTLELWDSVSVIAPNCHIYGNSSHFDDVVDPQTATSFLVGKSVQAIGYGHHFIQNVSPPLEHAPVLISDPLAAMNLPAAGACTFTNMVVSSDTVTLDPGTYCGGLTITTGADVALNPGLYIIAGGKFQVLDSTVRGSEVTVALADNLATLEWRNSKVRLSAQTSGQYTSMALIGVRQPVDHIFDSSIIDLYGVVYLLNGTLDWANVGTSSIHANWTAWIIDGVSWRGSGTININFNVKQSSIPYPPELMVIPRPGAPRMVF